MFQMIDLTNLNARYQDGSTSRNNHPKSCHYCVFKVWLKAKTSASFFHIQETWSTSNYFKDLNSRCPWNLPYQRISQPKQFYRIYSNYGTRSNCGIITCSRTFIVKILISLKNHFKMIISWLMKHQIWFYPDIICYSNRVLFWNNCIILSSITK